MDTIEQKVQTSRLWKWTRLFLIGAAVVTAGYFATDKALDYKYARNADEKSIAESGVAALFEGSAEAKKYFSADYVDYLTSTGYWDRIAQYELVDHKVFVDPSDEQTIHYFVQYKDKKTGEVTNNTGIFVLVQEGSQWKIAGE